MTIIDLDNVDKRAGAGFGTAAGEDIKSCLTELQGLTVTLVDGFAGGASADVSGASAGRSDTVITCIAFPTVGLPTQLTLASCSFSNDRIVIATTSTANKKVAVVWFDKSGF